MKLYNGCPCPKLQALWDSRADAREALSIAAKNMFGPIARARITYFPLEGEYHACMWIDGKYSELTGFHPTVESCSAAAISKLKQMHVNRSSGEGHEH